MSRVFPKLACPKLAWTAILLLALAVRLSPLLAGRPYINYVDEGNVLHHVSRLVRTGGWDPRWYLYPQLPLIAMTASARLYAPVYGAVHGRPFRGDLSMGRGFYDVLEPFDLLVIGRLLTLAAGLGTVLLAGLLARRLAGTPAGLFAAFLAALTPALAIRGAVTTVDPWASFFVLACLLFTDRARTSAYPGRESLTAGAMAGLAFAAKYPAVLVSVAFATTVLLDKVPWKEKLRRLVLAGAAAIVAALAAMPAILANTEGVVTALRRNWWMYSHRVSEDVLWRQALVRAEWDVPYEHPEVGLVFLGLAAAGFVVAVRDERASRTAWGWVAYLAVALFLFTRQAYQPFRNLLPLVAMSCIAIGVLFAKVRDSMRRPLWLDLAAAALVLLLFGLPVAGYARDRYRLRDARTEAVDWLAENARPEDAAVVVQELAFVRSELARLRAKPLVRRWPRAIPTVRGRSPRFLVAGVLLRKDQAPNDAAAHPFVQRRYRLRARFGEQPTPAHNGWWHGNRQIVYIFEAR